MEQSLTSVLCYKFLILSSLQSLDTRPVRISLRLLPNFWKNFCFLFDWQYYNEAWGWLWSDLTLTELTCLLLKTAWLTVFMRDEKIQCWRFEPKYCLNCIQDFQYYECVYVRIFADKILVVFWDLKHSMHNTLMLEFLIQLIKNGRYFQIIELRVKW